MTNKHNIEQPPLLQRQCPGTHCHDVRKSQSNCKHLQAVDESSTKRWEIGRRPITTSPCGKVCDPYSRLRAMYCSRMCLHIETYRNYISCRLKHAGKPAFFHVGQNNWIIWWYIALGNKSVNLKIFVGPKTYFAQLLEMILWPSNAIDAPC